MLTFTALRWSPFSSSIALAPSTACSASILPVRLQASDPPKKKGKKNFAPGIALPDASHRLLAGSGDAEERQGNCQQWKTECNGHGYLLQVPMVTVDCTLADIINGAVLRAQTGLPRPSRLWVLAGPSA